MVAALNQARRYIIHLTLSAVIPCGMNSNLVRFASLDSQAGTSASKTSASAAAGTKGVPFRNRFVANASRSASGRSVVQLPLPVQDGLIVRPSTIMWWSIGSTPRHLGDYQWPLLLAHDEMVAEQLSTFTVPRFLDYVPQQLEGQPTGIRNVSAALVGVVKMAITLFPDVCNEAIAAKMGMPERAFSAIERSYLSSYDRADRADYARLKWRGGLSRSDRHTFEAQMRYDQRFNPQRHAKELNLTIFGYMHEWVFTYNRPFMFRCHELYDWEKPDEGAPLAESVTWTRDSCGFLFGRNGYIYDDEGCMKSHRTLDKYRFVPFGDTAAAVDEH